MVYCGAVVLRRICGMMDNDRVMCACVERCACVFSDRTSLVYLAIIVYKIR